MSQIGFVMYLGHGGMLCPNGGYIAKHVVDDEEDQWEYIEDHGQSPHLTKPTDRSCLTMVNTNGIHFVMLGIVAVRVLRTLISNSLQVDCFLQPQRNPKVYSFFRCLMISSGTMWSVEPWP